MWRWDKLNHFYVNSGQGTSIYHFTLTKLSDYLFSLFLFNLLNKMKWTLKNFYQTAAGSFYPYKQISYHYLCLNKHYNPPHTASNNHRQMSSLSPHHIWIFMASLSLLQEVWVFQRWNFWNKNKPLQHQSWEITQIAIFHDYTRARLHICAAAGLLLHWAWRAWWWHNPKHIPSQLPTVSW